ncbi:MAG: ABC-2 transporter permease [Blautia sp.]|nr:ABC-2 transporter permease [Lachnoclostridium sp.]MCM1211377.1 ABC-2 transporter permease [Blautia sp.]
MKGLLVKDIRLVLHNARFMIILLLVMMVFVMQGNGNYAFFIGYSSMIFALLVLNTITYDVHNKGMTFLMTLPVKRGTYAVEKYILMLGGSLFGAVFSMVVCMLFYRSAAMQIFVEAIATVVSFMFFQMLMLPLQLKFTGEKSRMVLLGIFAVAIVVITSVKDILIPFLAKEGELQDMIVHIVMKFLSLDKWVIGMLVCLVFLGCLAVSFRVSVGIMRKKEF